MKRKFLLSPLTFGVIWNFYCSKLKGKHYKQNTSPKSYKTKIKILANPRLAYLGFEQHGPGRREELCSSLKHRDSVPGGFELGPLDSKSKRQPLRHHCHSRQRKCRQVNTAYEPGFCSMKRIEVFLLPPGWNASKSQGYPTELNLRVAIYTPGRREEPW